MSRRYQVTYGNNEAFLLEATAKERGIPTATLVRESSLIGLMTSYWKGLEDTILNSDISRIELNTKEEDEKIWKIMEIPAGFQIGFIAYPEVILNNNQPTWKILKSTYYDTPGKLLWVENYSMQLFSVLPGDIIYISLPKSCEPSEIIRSITIRFAYRKADFFDKNSN